MSIVSERCVPEISMGTHLLVGASQREARVRFVNYVDVKYNPGVSGGGVSRIRDVLISFSCDKNSPCNMMRSQD